ncbi:methionyl-trna synthetase [Panicum miliaceum]|uniref:Methionyl-trna synthetase n=1 Tax=Panicum miliaceum TaxID=4540 RepID=A0A3L6PKW7_PANMI|nr:methionyl-trna synthetase [Panicum miliaceum]
MKISNQLKSTTLSEEAPRTVVSSLVKYIPLEEMQNRKVCVLCNLKLRVCKYSIFPCSILRCSITFERIWGWTSKTTESKGALQPYRGVRYISWELPEATELVYYNV